MSAGIFKKFVGVTLILAAFCFGQTISRQQLVGTWESNIDGMNVVYVFHPNGTYERTWGQHKTGPNEFDVQDIGLVLEFFDEDFEETVRMGFSIVLSGDGRTFTINGHGESGSAVFRKR